MNDVHTHAHQSTAKWQQTEYLYTIISRVVHLIHRLTTTKQWIVNKWSIDEWILQTYLIISWLRADSRINSCDRSQRWPKTWQIIQNNSRYSLFLTFWRYLMSIFCFIFWLAEAMINFNSLSFGLYFFFFTFIVASEKFTDEQISHTLLFLAQKLNHIFVYSTCFYFLIAIISRVQINFSSHKQHKFCLYRLPIHTVRRHRQQNQFHTTNFISFVWTAQYLNCIRISSDAKSL